jgi:hypothetical protein
VFLVFISALEGNEVEVTEANFKGLSQLSSEFGFDDLSDQLKQFPPSTPFCAVDSLILSHFPPLFEEFRTKQ